MTFPFLTSASCLSPASGASGRHELPWTKGRSREAGEGRGKAGGGTLAGEQEGGKGRGEVHWGEWVPQGKVARLGGSAAGRAKRGKLQWSKEGMEILETEKLVREIELKKKGQNWLLQALRDTKTKENVRKVKSSSYKCLGYSEPTHKVPTASPRDREQPPLYSMNHNSYPPLRGQVSSEGVTVISPYSCLLFYTSDFF